MRSSLRRRGVALAGVSALALLGNLAAAHAKGADDQAATAPEAANAIKDVAPEVAVQTTPAPVSSDTDSAVLATTAGTTVDVPKNLADPVVVGARSAAPIAIRIDGTKSGDAKRTDNAMVVYQGTDTAASTAVQATDDGGVRFMTVISGPEAPSDYRFDMDVPAGARIVATSDGGFVIINADGVPAQIIAPPWAKDANGVSLPVSYSLDGTTIVMHVNHAGATYPVVADPWWKPWSWGMWKNKGVRGCATWGGIPAGTVIGYGWWTGPIDWGAAGVTAVGGCAAGGVSAYWH